MNANYEQCRSYACQNIINNLTSISISKDAVIELPPGTQYHLIGKVDTSYSNKNVPEIYYSAFKRRTFIPYTIINSKNISRYKGGIFFIYNLSYDDIVHIFPMDSDTNIGVTNEKDLTPLPSLWLTLSELESFSERLGVYNQITVKTKRNGQIIKPIAIAAFNKISKDIRKIADLFEIGIIVLHPDENAINYRRDLLHDYYKLQSISEVMEKNYGFPVISMYYAD